MTKGPVSAIGIRAKNSGQRKAALNTAKAAETVMLRAASLMKSRCLRWMTRKISNSKLRPIALE